MIPTPRFRWSCKVLGALVLGCALWLSVSVEARTPAHYFRFSVGHEQMQVGWNSSRLMVRLKPQAGEGIYRLVQRVFRKGYRSTKVLRTYYRSKRLYRDRYISLPLGLLDGKIRAAALQAVFPKDRSREKGWEHRVTHSWENLSLVAALFAKPGTSIRKLAQENRLRKRGNLLYLNDRILIPWQRLNPELGLKPKLKVRPPLYAKADRSGKVYAWYRMRKGEAVYSSVVARFTGRLLHDEVDTMTKQLLRLNGIRNARRIQRNQALKIPMEWLSEEWLEGGGALVQQPQRTSRKRAAKSQQTTKKTTHKNTANKNDPRFQFHVILDSGHGGRDPGATYGSSKRGDRIYEDEVVYDIQRRLIPLLQKSNFKVYPTLLDPNQRKPVSKVSRRHDQDEVVLVTPRYTIRNPQTGVNMRVFLVNYLYSKLRKQKIPQENILFLSLHADALHASLRGAMAYYPDHRLRKRVFGKRGQVYRKRKEYQRRVGFTVADNRESAVTSAAFGKSLISSFKKAKLPIHKSSNSVRGYLYRKGRKTLPAVLRYSKVPTSVLLEVANLNNKWDRRNLLKSQVRQQMANAIAQAVKVHFTSSGGFVASR